VQATYDIGLENELAENHYVDHLMQRTTEIKMDQETTLFCP
jgi:hypothetical protein